MDAAINVFPLLCLIIHMLFAAYIPQYNSRVEDTVWIWCYTDSVGRASCW